MFYVNLGQIAFLFSVQSNFLKFMLLKFGKPRLREFSNYQMSHTREVKYLGNEASFSGSNHHYLLITWSPIPNFGINPVV